MITLCVVDIMSNETTKDGLTVHLPQLRVFRDVAGYCGVCVSVCLYLCVSMFVYLS